MKRAPRRSAAAPKAHRLYFRHLPHRCGGGEVGPIGNCMACGAYDGEICRKPAETAAAKGETHFPPSPSRRGGRK